MTILDDEIRRIVDAVNASEVPEYCDMTPVEARVSHNQKADALGAPFVDLASVEDFAIPGQAADIAVRLYRPTTASAQPCIAFYHGGGHVIGSLESYDTLCRQLAHQSGVSVLSVDYRLAPEHPFPAAVDDALSAYRWLIGAGATRGLDQTNVAIGGDSAGGNLAAVTALLARDEGLPQARHQLLVYPATAAYPDSDSQLEFADGHILTRRLILWFHEQYLDYAAGDHTDPRWAPLLADSHMDLPPATIILAGCDPLRDEGIAYAKKLAEAGIDVALKVYAGTVHPFFSWSGAVAKARDAVTFAASALRDACARPDGQAATRIC